MWKPGRAPAAFAAFLQERAGHDLPDPLHTLPGDVEARAAQVLDLATARIVECAGAALALLVTRDRTLRADYTPLGEPDLAITQAARTASGPGCAARLPPRPAE